MDQQNRFSIADGKSELLLASVVRTSVSTINSLVVEDMRVSELLSTVGDSLHMLRRMVKLLESQATVDIANRQRVTVDAMTP